MVIGGGIIGLCIALVARVRHPDQRVLVLEKEPQLGLHASGRNSGVLHAGFYYSADSLKARFCRSGSLRMKEFCEEHQLSIGHVGKLVVAKNAGEHAGLDELLRRGVANGVKLEAIDADEAVRIEPRARTYERAIFSPNTRVVNPREVIAALVREAERQGVELAPDTAYRGRQGDTLLTSRGEFRAGFVINAAGLYADRIARDFGFAQHYRVMPFRGLYLYGDEPEGWLRTNVYPVPDLKFPFLGVHFTVTVDGHAKIGPTALPGFWRENYGGWSGFSMRDLSEVASRGLWMLATDPTFRRLAMHEFKKSRRAQLLARAGELVEGLDTRRWTRFGPSGIRAQLLDLRSHQLEMDFVGEGDDRSYHVLNAVSPAFTCSWPLAEHVWDAIDGRDRGADGA